jgi:REP-associated tyrosine transposase
MDFMINTTKNWNKMVRFSRHTFDNPDDIYFITIALKNRNIPFVQDDEYDKILRCMKNSMNKENGELLAYVINPDHIHLLIKQGDISFSKRVQTFKIQSNYAIFGEQKPLWQKRFWEHRIKNDHDYLRHVEYIHFNPVKHGNVNSPKDWEYSSFSKFVEESLYDKEWSSEIDIVVGSGAWDS